MSCPASQVLIFKYPLFFFRHRNHELALLAGDVELVSDLKPELLLTIANLITIVFSIVIKLRLGKRNQATKPALASPMQSLICLKSREIKGFRKSLDCIVTLRLISPDSVVTFDRLQLVHQQKVF